MSSKELLKNYTTPEDIASVHTRKLSNILSKASKGRGARYGEKQKRSCLLIS